MDVIPHARSIHSVVVVSKNIEALAPADCHLLDKGHEVVGNAVRAFPYLPGWVCAHGVEVPQDRDTELLVCNCGIPHDLLDHVLRPTVRVGATQRLLLINWLLMGPVDSRRGREDDGITAAFLHRRENVQGPDDVVRVVPQWLGNRLANSFQAGEVDHTIKLLLREETLNTFSIAHVRLEERDLLPRKLLHSLHGLRAGIHKVVHDRHLEARL
mmetsp:Transcript_17874/g.37955  ORF Transcript_17874/g.37955 Transcript_17874/m.37955 type:complete len:213 (-) Transcript_17874:167-805(-)